MLSTDDGLVLSPTDLVDLMECDHRSLLNQALAVGLPGVPKPEASGAQLVAKHGLAHEQAVLQRFRARHGAGVVEIDQPAPIPAALAAAAEQTRDALTAGALVVYQPVFYDSGFYGRADFLVLTSDGEYEPYDAKLARHARPAAVLQLTAYADALARAGHRAGRDMHLMLGDGTQHSLRVADFLPLLTHLRDRLRERLSSPVELPQQLWADERPACSVCRFAKHCATGRAAARDLSLVAGMRTDQRRKLVSAGLDTIDALAGATLQERPSTLSIATFTGLRAQATIQIHQDATRTEDDPTGKVSYEIVSPGALAELPSPSPGDVFFDMEGDPYALGGTGLEYLFGAVTDPSETFTPFWAHTRAQEKKAFEDFVDFALARIAEHPSAHIYHYAPYETSALKRLAALHSTREEEVDTLLRAGALIDLYAVVRKALRVSQRSYSIKYLEPLYMPAARAGDVQTAASSIEAYEDYLSLVERGEHARAEQVLAGISDYNEYDCVSTHRLYRFLLEVRDEAGIEPVAAPDLSTLDKAIESAADEQAAERRAERAAKLAAVVEPLMADLPDNPALASDDERARGLLAAAVGYHRRETNPAWWEFFRQVAAPLSDLEADSACAVPVAVRPQDWTMPSGRIRTAKREVHTVCDPDRPHPFTTGDQVRLLYPGASQGWTRDGVVLGASTDSIVVQESAKPTDLDQSSTPVAVLPGSPVRPSPKDEAVADLAQHVVDHLPALPAHPGVDLLRRTPRLRGGRLPDPSAFGGDLVTTVINAVDLLDDSALAVQGPPGAGKTYLAGRLIAHLVGKGKKVAVTSTSHKAVENVLSAVQRTGSAVPCAKRPKKTADPDLPWEQPKNNAALVSWRADHPGGHLVGGTAWTFANAAMRADPFDVLIIDEAGQFALADALAVSMCARNLVLLGDPQQLPQVVQGTHPAGADASALGHLIGAADVIPTGLGYFLDQSRRMHPAVCAPVSQLSYAGLLHAHPSAANRSVAGVEAGLYLASVDHRHNITSSTEEAVAVAELVTSLVGRMWTDTSARPLADSDIMVVAPYNLQVRVVQRELKKAGHDAVRVGTVDRFQGQEAPVVIATMTSSSAVDLPRGLEFLLSRNRLNVALSRAQAVAVVVCSPRLIDADIRTVDQMRLVSGMLGLMTTAHPVGWTP